MMNINNILLMRMVEEYKQKRYAMTMMIKQFNG